MVKSPLVLALTGCLLLASCDDGSRSQLQRDKESLIAQIDALKKQLADATGTVADAGGALSSAQAEVARLLKAVEDREELLASLRGQVDGLAADLQKRLAQITGLEGQVGQLGADVQSRLAQITSLEAQIGNVQSDLTGALKQLGDANGLVASLRNEVARLTAALTAKEGGGNPIDALRGLIPGAKPPAQPAQPDPPPA